MGTVYKRGNVWWVKYYRNGKPFFESAGSKRKTDALRLLKDREGDIVKGVPVTPMVNKVTLGELYQDMVTDYEVNKKRSLPDLRHRFEKYILPFGESANCLYYDRRHQGVHRQATQTRVNQWRAQQGTELFEKSLLLGDQMRSSQVAQKASYPNVEGGQSTLRFLRG